MRPLDASLSLRLCVAKSAPCGFFLSRKCAKSVPSILPFLFLSIAFCAGDNSSVFLRRCDKSNPSILPFLFLSIAFCFGDNSSVFCFASLSNCFLVAFIMPEKRLLPVFVSPALSAADAFSPAFFL